MEGMAITALGAALAEAGVASLPAGAVANGIGTLAVAGAQAAGFLPATPAAATAQSSGFAALVQAGLAEVDGQLKTAQTSLQQLSLGEASSLHQVMAAMEESRIGFQLLLQVRNRLLDSYQEVMRMQL